MSQNPSQTKTLLPILTSNLDREITRYKKEQSDIQAEATRSDTNFELAKRKYLIFSISFLLAFLGLSSFISYLVLRLELLWPKVMIGLLFLFSILGIIYNLL